MSRFVGALRALGFAAAVAIVVVIAVRAARGFDPSALTWWPLVLALPCALAWWLLLAHGWALLAAGGPSRDELGLWLRTQPLRFLPGALWAPAARSVAVRGRRRRGLVAVAGENLLGLSAAVALAGLALALAGRGWWWLALVPAPVAPLLAARVLHGRVAGLPPSPAAAMATYLGAFLAYAVMATLVQVAVSGRVEVLDVAGAATLAWAAGLVVVFAPGGIGVREAVFVALLAGALPEAELAAGAVAVRVVTLAVELVALLALGAPRATAPATARP